VFVRDHSTTNNLSPYRFNEEEVHCSSLMHAIKPSALQFESSSQQLVLPGFIAHSNTCDAIPTVLGLPGFFDVLLESLKYNTV
jgi:hypothetical protein